MIAAKLAPSTARCSPVVGTWILGLVLSLTACAPIASTAVPDLSIVNGTTLNVALFINGASVGHTFRQSSSSILGRDLPALPWHVEARTSKGRVLTTLVVAPATIAKDHGAASHVDLSCGSLWIYVGAEPPDEAPGRGVPGDCEP